MKETIENQIYAKLNNIENEIENLKILTVSKSLKKPKKIVSIKGLAKSLVSEKELDKAIEKAKKSLLKGG